MTETSPEDLLCDPQDDDKRRAFVDLFGRVYARLRGISQSLLWNPNDSLTPTGLIHSSYERLLEAAHLSRGDANSFLALSANALKQTLIDIARARKAEKRGGEVVFTTSAEAPDEQRLSAEALLTIQAALENLAAVSEEQALIVDYRFYLGLTEEETAEVLGIGIATVQRRWKKAKAWLHHALGPSWGIRDVRGANH